MTANQENSACPPPPTVAHGTEVSAFGLLEIAVFTTSAVYVMETTHGSAAQSIPLALFAPALPPLPLEGGSERVQTPTTFPVHSVYNVPFAFDQPCRMLCSVTLFCSGSAPVPVCLFSP